LTKSGEKKTESEVDRQREDNRSPSDEEKVEEETERGLSGKIGAIVHTEGVCDEGHTRSPHTEMRPTAFPPPLNFLDLSESEADECSTDSDVGDGDGECDVVNDTLEDINTNPTERGTPSLMPSDKDPLTESIYTFSLSSLTMASQTAVPLPSPTDPISPPSLSSHTPPLMHPQEAEGEILSLDVSTTEPPLLSSIGFPQSKQEAERCSSSTSSSLHRTGKKRKRPQTESRW
jgi:hypothetical protein